MAWVSPALERDRMAHVDITGQYRRPSSNQYTAPDVFEDVAIGYAAYPNVGLTVILFTLAGSRLTMHVDLEIRWQHGQGEHLHWC